MALQQIKQDCPDVPFIEPKSLNYAEVRSTYRADTTAQPLAIAQPSTSHEVSQLVTAAVKHGVKIVVRSGGHDLYGRSMVQDALTIDMRKIDFVRVAEDKKSACIGGGALVRDIVKKLQAEELITPTGTVGSVGYAGWATLGGYGWLANHFGLGVDQLLGAEVVDCEGKVIDAPADMMKSIRGGGGNFGVITSLTVKVYPSPPFLAGMIVYESTHLKDTVRSYFRAIQSRTTDFPSALQLQPCVVNFPPIGGKAFMVLFDWSSPDHAKAHEALQDVLSTTPKTIAVDVKETNITDMLASTDEMVPPKVIGGPRTASFGKFDEDVLDVLGTYAENMPSDRTTMISLHEFSSISPSAKTASYAHDSSFPSRVGHHVVEIIGSVVEKENEVESSQWAASFQEALFATGKALDHTYISLTVPGSRTLRQVYGEKFEVLQQQKDKYDPDGVFDLAVPRIRTGMA